MIGWDEMEKSSTKESKEEEIALSKKDKEVVEFLKELAEEPVKDKKEEHKVKYKQKTIQKPFGITILTILFILTGLLGLMGSVMGLIYYPNNYSYLPPYDLINNPGYYLFSLYYTLVMSIIILITAYGLYKSYYKGFRWAWRGAMIIMVLALLGNLTNGNFAPAILNIIVIVYLTRRHVRVFFRTEDLPPSIP